MKLFLWLGKPLPGKAAAALFLVALIVCCSAEAEASLLNAGASLNPSPAAVDIGGTGLATESPGFNAGTYSGILTSTVEQNDPSNPFGAGDLTFIFSLTDAAPSTAAIQRLSVNGFAGFNVDASFVTAAGLIAPAVITRSSDGSVIGFTFQNRGGFTPLSPGGASTELVVHTNATTFASTTAAIIGGNITSAPTYMPVPEPSSIALAGLGLSAVVALGWRRRRAA